MSSKAKVIFWDVQHGHATYIQSPNNRHIVVDLGTGRYETGRGEFSPLLHLKEDFGVQRLDYVVITHPHKDHIDDILNFDALAPKVLRRPKHLKRGEVMKDVREQDVPKYEKYFEINDRYNSTVGPEDSPRNPDSYGGMIGDNYFFFRRHRYIWCKSSPSIERSFPQVACTQYFAQEPLAESGVTYAEAFSVVERKSNCRSSVGWRPWRSGRKNAQHRTSTTTVLWSCVRMQG